MKNMRRRKIKQISSYHQRLHDYYTKKMTMGANTVSSPHMEFLLRVFAIVMQVQEDRLVGIKLNNLIREGVY